MVLSSAPLLLWSVLTFYFLLGSYPYIPDVKMIAQKMNISVSIFPCILVSETQEKIRALFSKEQEKF